MRRFLTDRVSFLSKKKPSEPADVESEPAQPLRLEPLGRAESVALLRALAGSGAADADFERLAECLGDLPAALGLAGRYLARHPKVSAGELLAEIEKAGAARGTLTALTALVLQELRHEKLALQAFAAAGFCEPADPIPFAILRGASGLQEKQQPRLDHALEKLYSFGLLEQSAQGPVIYPQVAEAAHAVVDQEISQYTGDKAEDLLSRLAEALLEAEFPSGPLFLPHLRSIAVSAESAAYTAQAGVKQSGPLKESAPLKESGPLWNLVGTALEKSAGEGQAHEAAQDAAKCYERALACAEKSPDTPHADLVLILNNLARLQHELGDLQGAKTSYRHLMLLDERFYSPDYPDVATDAHHLGQVLYDLGDLPEAKSCFERALAIHESAYGYGPRHPTVAADSASLGRVLQELGDNEGAKTCYERALQVNEWTYGPRHLSVAAAAAQLGRALRQMGDHAGAGACFERQLAIEEIAHGLDHPALAHTLNSLGVALQDQGQVAKAMACFERALAIDRKHFPPDHPDIARDLNNLGGAARELGDLQKARQLFSQALEINDRAGEPRTHEVGTNANNLGRVLYNLKDYPGARICFERVLAIDEKIYGSHSTEVTTDLTNLGIVLNDLGDREGARSCYERALAILEKILPAGHARLQKVRKYLDQLNGNAEAKESA